MAAIVGNFMGHLTEQFLIFVGLSIGPAVLNMVMTNPEESFKQVNQICNYTNKLETLSSQMKRITNTLKKDEKVLRKSTILLYKLFHEIDAHMKVCIDDMNQSFHAKLKITIAVTCIITICLLLYVQRGKK